MDKKDIIRMTQEELRRVSIVHQAMGGLITQKKAAEVIRISEREVRRLIKRVREEGDRGVIHRSRGKPSNRRIDDKLRNEVIEIYNKRYWDFGPTLASEKLSELDKIDLDHDTLRCWLRGDGKRWEWQGKGRKHRQWRERKEYFGEMVQMDGSHHDWLEERGPELVFMGYVDDATNTVFARFYDYEGTIPALDSFMRYIKKYGIPQSIYLDKHTTYKSTREPTIEEQLRDEKPMSQFERAMEELGVGVLHANSPQAKGRIERVFGTFQDRLVKEMRLKDIKTSKEASRFLNCYLPLYNKRFSFSPAKEGNLHRAIPEGLDLDKILCIRTKRALRNDFTIAHNKRLYQILEHINTKKVVVEERINGSMFITDNGRSLKYKEIAKRLIRPREPQKQCVSTIRDVYRPPILHPWKRPMYERMLASKQAHLQKENEETMRGDKI